MSAFAPLVLAQTFREFFAPSPDSGIPERFAATPHWQLCLATVLLCLVSAEAGYRIGRWMRGRLATEPEAPLRAMVTATLALLTFLLVFTFNFAAHRREARQELRIEQVNALRTAWLRTVFLPQPHQEQSRALLRRYVEDLAEAERTGRVRQAVERTGEVQKELSAAVVAFAKAEPGSGAVESFSEALEEVSAVRTQRMFVGLRNRIPPPVWIAVFLLAGLALMTEGYLNGLTGSRRALALVAVSLSLSLVIVLIAAMESPTEGFLRISNVALEELLLEMR